MCCKKFQIKRERDRESYKDRGTRDRKIDRQRKGTENKTRWENKCKVYLHPIQKRIFSLTELCYKVEINVLSKVLFTKGNILFYIFIILGGTELFGNKDKLSTGAKKKEKKRQVDRKKDQKSAIYQTLINCYLPNY